MMASAHNDVSYAIYLQNCQIGVYKSIGVIVGTVVIFILVGIICCCLNRPIAKQLRRLEIANSVSQKTMEERALAR